MTNRQTNPEKPKYFDLDINGIGYLNRAREVTPENGIPFLSVTIAALRGPADKVQHTHFDSREYIVGIGLWPRCGKLHACPGHRRWCSG